jgi:hypothetical protein
MAIRFVSVSCGEFESLKLQCCELFPSHSFKFELSNQHNVSLPDQTVSMWCRSSESYSKYQSTVKDCL